MSRDKGSSAGRRSSRSGVDGGPGGLDLLRRKIDELDRQLVVLLNERAGHALALAHIKKEQGLPIYQPAREEEVLGNIQACNRGPLEDAALRRVFERIIDESRRIERTGMAGAGDGEKSGPQR